MDRSEAFPPTPLEDLRFPDEPLPSTTFDICRTDPLKPFLFWYKPTHVVISTYGCKPSYITHALDAGNITKSIILRDRIQTKRSWHAKPDTYGAAADSDDDEPYPSSPSQGSSQLTNSQLSSLDDMFEADKANEKQTRITIAALQNAHSNGQIDDNGHVIASNTLDTLDNLDDNDAHSISSDVSNVSFGNNETHNVLKVNADMNYESQNGKHQFIDLTSTYIDENCDRKRPRGTVHSKYVLGFSSNALHLCVTTANFSGACDQTDGYWCGTFPRIEKNSTPITTFGKTFLAHFKQQIISSLCVRERKNCKAKTAKAGERCHYCLGDRCKEKVESFLKEVKLDSVDDIILCYDWAVPPGIELVISRPGKIGRECEVATLHPTETNVQHLLSAGDQVAKILEKHAVKLDGAEGKDKLYIQPTSMGNNLDAGELHEYAKSLSRDQCSDDYRILWPRLTNNNNLAFWKDDIFVNTPYEVLDSLYKYDIDVRKFGRFHHFKSIFVQDGELNDESRMRFKYFLMTSCCLSVGAIGANNNRGLLTTEKEYKNYEMGVMFISKPNRVYTNYQDDDNGVTIQLPLPFTVGPRYLDEDTMKFSEWPKIALSAPANRALSASLRNAQSDNRVNLGMNGQLLPMHPALLDSSETRSLLGGIFDTIAQFCENAKPGEQIKFGEMSQPSWRKEVHEFCESCNAGLQHWSKERKKGGIRDIMYVKMPGLTEAEAAKEKEDSATMEEANRKRPREEKDDFSPPMPSFD